MMKNGTFDFRRNKIRFYCMQRNDVSPSEPTEGI